LSPYSPDCADVCVHSNKEADSNGTFVTALGLQAAIEEEDEDSLRTASITKDVKKENDIEYSILVSERAICSYSEQGTQISAAHPFAILIAKQQSPRKQVTSTGSSVVKLGDLQLLHVNFCVRQNNRSTTHHAAG
jgi:hypothetical protein